MSNLVECQNASKTFKYEENVVNALSDISITVKSGGFMCLSGPSGSGKTTLLNLIGGLDRPSSGEILVDGNKLSTLNNADLAELRLNKLGFVFQSYNLIPVLSARENVEFIMQLQGCDRDDRREKANRALNEVGLEGMEKRRPAQLSGGQQQRVAIARAIASEPLLILADEPTANLDSNTAGKLLELIKELNEKHGITFIISTHDKLVMNYAKCLVHMHDGKIERVENMK